MKSMLAIHYSFLSPLLMYILSHFSWVSCFVNMSFYITHANFQNWSLLLLLLWKLTFSRWFGWQTWSKKYDNCQCRNFHNWSTTDLRHINIHFTVTWKIYFRICCFFVCYCRMHLYLRTFNSSQKRNVGQFQWISNHSWHFSGIPC